MGNEDTCELCGKLGYHVSVVYGWARRDTSELERVPDEGTLCIERCDELEIFGNDEAAAIAAAYDGVDCGEKWPFFVSPEGLKTWEKIIKDEG